MKCVPENGFEKLSANNDMDLQVKKGTAVISLCCGKELPERGMWSDKMGG